MTLVFPRREAEAQAFLDANPDIETVQVVWTDLCGVARGKVLRRDEVVPAWKDGRFMPISALVLDVTGQDVPETGLVFDEGDRDRADVAGAGHLRARTVDGEDRAVYGLHPRSRRYAALRLPPERARKDRHALQERTEHDAGGRGGTRVLPDGPRVRTVRQAHGAEIPDQRAPAAALQAYYLQDTDDFAPFFKDLYAWCEVQDLPAKTLISEYAPGQMEIVLRHRADVMDACDEGVMLKRLIKACAEKHGLAATFMAKPYSEWTGSGMHIHISLADEEGNNLFAAGRPAAE